MTAVFALTGCPEDPMAMDAGSTTGSDSSGGPGGGPGGGPASASDSTTSPAADSTADGTGSTSQGSTTDPLATTGSTSADGSSSGDGSESSSGSVPVECTTLSLATTEFLGSVVDGEAFYSMPVESLGAEILPDRMVMLLTSDDTGALELGQGANAIIDTCEQCVALLIDEDPSSGPDQVLFADMGVMTIDAATPPISSDSLIANLDGVRLAEIDLDTQVLVPNGDCIELEDVAVTGATSIDGWTCFVEYYGTNDGCDCGCGIVDPDCADTTAGSCEFCEQDAGSCVPDGVPCVDGVLPDDNATCDLAALWSCDPALFDAGDGVCNCGCLVQDPDCEDSLVNRCDSCGDVGSCAEGQPDCGTITPAVNSTCNPVPGWSCPPDFYDADDGCDCGCGLPDPDCADATVESCGFCGNVGSCAPLASDCPGIITPDDNSTCTPGVEWTCDLALYGAGDGVCNCGCGVPDPDCEGPQGGFCDVCDDVGSCGEGMGGCEVTADPDQNYLCN